MHIYSLLGDERYKALPEFKELSESHDQFLKDYRNQKWEAASSYIAEYLKTGNGQLDQLYELYEERIREFIANPPGSDWDGVFVATSK